MNKKVKATFAEIEAANKEGRVAQLEGGDLHGQTLKGVGLRGADMRGMRLDHTDMSGADLRGVDLSGSSMIGAKLGRAKLDKAVLREADLTHAWLKGASLVGADLRGAIVQLRQLKEAKFDPRALEEIVQEKKLPPLDLQISPSGIYDGSLHLSNLDRRPLPAALKRVTGSVYLQGYDTPIPVGLSQIDGHLDIKYTKNFPPGLRRVGGWLDLENVSSSEKLPDGLIEVGGSIRLGSSSPPLPDTLRKVHGDIELSRFWDHSLPAGLTEIGGDIDLSDCSRPLPAGLRRVGGSLKGSIRDRPLPDGLEFVGKNLDLRSCQVSLPRRLRGVGGDLHLEGYNFPLPNEFESVGGDVNLEDYNYPLPDSFKSVGGTLYLHNYRHRLPPSLVSAGAVSIGNYNEPFPISFTVNNIEDNESYRFELPKEPLKSEQYQIKVPDTDNFRRWFAGSKAVMEDGSPAVVYHGTDYGGYARFDPKMLASHNPGFFFTDDLFNASTYVSDPEWPLVDPTPPIGKRSRRDVRGIYRVFLSLKNPAVIDCNGSHWSEISHPGFHNSQIYEIAGEAKRRGFDGAIFLRVQDPGMKSSTERAPKVVNIYVAFDPTQIKSATVQTGEYSPTNPDIRKNPRRTSRGPVRRTSRGRKTSKR